MTKTFRYRLPVTLWFIICTVLLTLPGSSFPKKSIFDSIPYFDKYVHIGLFAVLTFLGCLAITVKNHVETYHRYFIMCGIVAFIYGILMEFVQHYFIPNRSFDIYDMLADGAGALLGGAISLRIWAKK